MPFDSETATEAGKQGGIASGRSRSQSPEERAIAAVKRKAPDLMKDLLAAALGQAPFEQLKPETRVGALLRALEYGVGKPVVPRGDSRKVAEEEGGITLG